jgi:hypothetical protein
MDGIKGAFAVKTSLLAVNYPLTLLLKWERLRCETQSSNIMDATDEKTQSPLESEFDARSVI